MLISLQCWLKEELQEFDSILLHTIYLYLYMYIYIYTCKGRMWWKRFGRRTQCPPSGLSEHRLLQIPWAGNKTQSRSWECVLNLLHLVVVLSVGLLFGGHPLGGQWVSSSPVCLVLAGTDHLAVPYTGWPVPYASRLLLSYAFCRKCCFEVWSIVFKEVAGISTLLLPTLIPTSACMWHQTASSFISMRVSSGLVLSRAPDGRQGVRGSVWTLWHLGRCCYCEKTSVVHLVPGHWSRTASHAETAGSVNQQQVS